jgi:hypothetical protein
MGVGRIVLREGIIWEPVLIGLGMELVRIGRELGLAHIGQGRGMGIVRIGRGKYEGVVNYLWIGL